MRTVIVHESDGIFIGASLGMAFFSKLDAAGQTNVCTFVDEADARDFISEWKPAVDADSFTFVEVDTDKGYADIEELCAAGLQDEIGFLLENVPAAASC